MFRLQPGVLVDMLVEDHLVCLDCHLPSALPALGEVAAWFANTRDIMPVTGRFNWRAFVVGSSYRQARRVLDYAKDRITSPGFRMWNAAAVGRHGSLRAVVAEPDSVQGITGHNLLFIILSNQDKRVWDAIWAATVEDTKILAVNAELFGQWTDFTHIE